MVKKKQVDQEEVTSKNSDSISNTEAKALVKVSEKTHQSKEVTTKVKVPDNNIFSLTTVVKVLAGLFLLIIIISGFKNMSPSVKSSSSEEGYFQGAKNAPIVMIEWSDFQCPYCGKFYANTYSKIKEEYIAAGKVKLMFKHFPLSFHENAQKAAEASECAGEQDKFWEMHNKLFENQQALAVTDLKKYAVELDLKEDKFNDCLDTSKYAKKVADDMQQGQTAGISGTPGFTINGVLISGAQPYENFKKVFEQILAGETPTGDQPEPSADSQLADSTNDPEIVLTIVNDKNCKACTTTSVSNINKQAFKTVKEKLVDVNSKEGKELMKKYEIKALPFYIYDSKIKEAANYDKIQQALVEKDTTYYINPEAGVAVKLLETPKMTFDHVKGKADAKVTIVEWSDFQCPYCGKFFTETFPELQKQFIDTGKVKLVYKHFPLSFHQNAQKAAEASECVGEQDKDKFWAVHDKIFENQQALTIADLKKYAADLKLDTKKFDDCLDTSKYAEKVKADMELGAKVGVSGTPGFLINGIIVSGAQPFAAFEQIIKDEFGE